MGKTKKPFIDKSKAVTYRLVFKSSEYGEKGQERIFVPVRGTGNLHPELDSEHGGNRPMSSSMAMQYFWGGEEPTEEERKEILTLGLPDDGYNYLQHVRAVGQGTSHLEREEGNERIDSKSGEDAMQTSSAGGSVSSKFTPPPEDRKVIIARNLTVHEEVEDEEAAASCTYSTSAFSREVEGVRGTVAKEFDELEEVMATIDEDVGENIGTDGVGDLLDDFVINAAKANDSAATFMGDARARENPHNFAMPQDILEEEGEDEEDDVIEFDYISRYSKTLGSRGAGDQSVFSERWAGTCASDLEGRRARNDHLTLLDEKFENMLLEYDDDELGDLEPAVDDIQGDTHLREFAPELQIFADDVNLKGLRALVRERDIDVLVDRDDDVIMITKELENAVLKGRRRIGRDEWEDVLVCVRSNSSQLDCETVLSYRSKASSFQPSRIFMTPAPKKKDAPAKIPLSGQVALSLKTGFPLEAAQGAVAPLEPISESACEESSNDKLKNPQERRKGETPEERKARKTAVKESQRIARARKKEMKVMYKKEHIKQQKQMAGILLKSASTVTL